MFARRYPALRWLFAMAVVIFAWLCQEHLREIVGGRSFLMLMPAALVGAVVGGFGPGVVATALAVGLAWYRFVPPVGSFELQTAGDAFSIVVVTLTGLAFSVVGEAFARALDREVLANERANQALHARDEFLAVATHEFRNPLMTLGLSLDLLDRLVRQSGDAGALLKRVSTARGQVGALKRLVSDLVDVTRARQGSLTIVPDDADLVTIVREAAQRAADAVEAAGGTLQVEAEAPVPCRCDASRMEQVVTNLLANAARYAPGTPVVVDVARAGGHPVVSVRDHGPGIPDDLRTRLFQPFQRGTASGSGLGLGLFVARTIVEAHGGRLTAEAADGGGARFRVELPG